MVKHYETVFILTPVLSEEQVKETVKKFTDYLKEHKASIVVEENWGLKKLQYPIQNKKSGFYYLVEFSSEDSSIISNFELQFRRDERVLRYLTVAMDKHHLEYSVKRRERLGIKA